MMTGNKLRIQIHKKKKKKNFKQNKFYLKAIVQGWADTNFYSLVPFEVEKLYVLGMGGYH